MPGTHENASAQALPGATSTVTWNGSALQTPPTQDCKLRVLDLFSGTGSVAAVFRRQGYEVTTVDQDPKMKADVQVDILAWKYRKMFRPGEFKIVFAAPPCTEYSQALTSRPRDMEAADRLVKKTLEVIKYLRPEKWFLENPSTGYLKTRGLLKGIAAVKVDYCRFSPWGYQKPTQIWGTVEGLKNVLCDSTACPNMTLQEELDGSLRRRHRVKLEGSIVPLRERYRIPTHLVAYLMRWKRPPPPSQIRREVLQYLKHEPLRRQQQFHLRRRESTEKATIYGIPQKVLEPRHLLPVAQLIRLCNQNGPKGHGMQLLMGLSVVTHDGCKHHLQALVDTGAQTNCIRHDALPRCYFMAAKIPISLSTVSGEALPGGSQEVQVELQFKPTSMHGKPLRVKSWKIMSNLYEANMQVDMILGYPWLRENKIGVLRHENAFTSALHGQQILLRG